MKLTYPLFGGPKHGRHVEVEPSVRFLTHGDEHYDRAEFGAGFYWVEGPGPIATLKGNLLVPVRRRGSVTVTPTL